MTSTSVLKGNISQYSDLLILMNGQWILKFQCWRVFSLLTRNQKHFILHLSTRQILYYYYNNFSYFFFRALLELIEWNKLNTYSSVNK